MIHRGASWPVVVLLVLGAAGCPHRFDFGPRPADDGGEVLARARAGLARPRTLRGEAKLKFRLPEGSFGADHLVALEVPDRLRLDTLSFFGSPLAVLLLREGKLLLWDIEGEKAYRGEATVETLRMVLPLELEPADVISMVLGDPPEIEAGRTRLLLDHAARAYRVERVSQEGRQRFWVDPLEGHLLRVSTEPNTGEPWEVRYEDYRPLGTGTTGMLPFTVRYSRGESSMVWRWRSLEADADDFSREVFELVLPEEVSTVNLDGIPARGSGRAVGEGTVKWLPEEAPRKASP